MGAVDVCAVVVEEMGRVELVAAEGVVKCIVRRAGPDWFLVREMVIGIAGLWNFRRRRQVRQKTLWLGLVVLRLEVVVGLGRGTGPLRVLPLASLRIPCVASLLLGVISLRRVLVAPREAGERVN